MIRLIVNNQEVYLDEDLSLRFDLVHPAFENEYLYASMVYPFDIPAHRNQEIFKHSNHIVVNSKYRIYDCKFIFGNSFNFTGKLVLSKLSKTSYRGSIICNGFSIDAKDRKLNEFSFDDDVTLGTSTSEVAATVESVVEKSFPDSNFNFPLIEAPNWYGQDNEHNQDFGNYLNCWLLESQSIRLNGIYENPTPDNPNSLLPCLYLMYIIKSCFSELGFRAFGNPLTHSELSQLLVFNNKPLDYIENKYAVKASNSTSQTITSANWWKLHFDDDSSGENHDEDECWNTTLFEYQIRHKGYYVFSVRGSMKNNDLLGTVNDWNIRVYNLTNSTVISSHATNIPGQDTHPLDWSSDAFWFSDSNIGDKIAIQVRAAYYDMGGWNPSTFIYSQMKLDVTNASFANWNSFKKTLHHADHVPDISFGELISSVSKAFGLFYIFDHEHGDLEIEFLQSLLDNPNAIDLSHCFIDGSHEINLKESEGYKCNFSWDGEDFDEETYYKSFPPQNYLGAFDTIDDLPIPLGLNVYALVRNTNALYYYHLEPERNELRWDLHSYNYPDILKTPSKKEIKPSLSPLMVRHDPNDGIVYPTTLIKCTSPSFPTGENSCDLHLVFYRGMEETKGESYPFATPLAYDRYGDRLWDHELRFDGDYGFLSHFLSDWYNFLDDANDVSMDLSLSLEDLRNIMKLFLPQKGKKFRKVAIHNAHYIPKKFSVMLTMDGVKSCQANLLKKGMIS